jgi:hypothetical protein
VGEKARQRALELRLVKNCQLIRQQAAWEAWLQAIGEVPVLLLSAAASILAAPSCMWYLLRPPLQGSFETCLFNNELYLSVLQCTH